MLVTYPCHHSITSHSHFTLTPFNRPNHTHGSLVALCCKHRLESHNVRIQFVEDELQRSHVNLNEKPYHQWQSAKPSVFKGINS